MDENTHDLFLEWRDIPKDEMCHTCGGSGRASYGNTSTWKGGIGGQAMRVDICDQCWGTGNITRKGVNLKELMRKGGHNE